MLFFSGCSEWDITSLPCWWFSCHTLSAAFLPPALWRVLQSRTTLTPRGYVACCLIVSVGTNVCSLLMQNRQANLTWCTVPCSMQANGTLSRRKTQRDSSSRTTSLPNTPSMMMEPWLPLPRAASLSLGKWWMWQIVIQ